MKPNESPSSSATPPPGQGFVWTPELIGQALASKQKKLSECMTFISDLEDAEAESSRTYETLEAKLSLNLELANPDMSDKKISMRVKASDEFQVAWSEYIVAKSKLRRCKNEIRQYEKELKTLEQISISVGVDLKYLNR